MSTIFAIFAMIGFSWTAPENVDDDLQQQNWSDTWRPWISAFLRVPVHVDGLGPAD